MMISKTAIYGPPSLANNGFPSGLNQRVHGLPIPSSMNYDNGKLDTVTDSRNMRNSYKDEDSSSIHSGSRTPPPLSALSGSMESIDDVDISELENDPDLIIKENEPEAWSVTVEKKLLKKMHKKDVKRQDNIFEFIQKERNFLTTLKIMQKIFARGMAQEAQLDQDVIDKMFPMIDEFVELTSQLVQQLDERQQRAQIVEKIGDVLVQHWSGDSGRLTQKLFSEFCSKQTDIVAMYKDMLKNDKKFLDFTRKCSKNPLTRRRDIPGCILLVTQRITKYPVILKTLIDNSSRKEHEADNAKLNNALVLITDIIKNVDAYVLEYEKQRKLKDICQRMENKTHATYKDGRKFIKDDLLDPVRKLLQSGLLQWKVSTIKRPADVTLLLFSDSLVFLQENNQRFSFPSVGQPAVVPLHKLIVREKAGEDNVLFLLSASSNQPEMYELVCQNGSDSKNWMNWIRAAADECPEEDEGVSHEEVEEQRILEQKWERAHQLISELEKRDAKINELLQEKMERFEILAKVVERPEVTANMKFRYNTYYFDENVKSEDKLPHGTPILQKAIDQVNKLSHAMCGPGGLSRNPSSVGEHESGTFTTNALPKRSETFGGFDNGKEPPSPRGKWPMNLSKLTSKGDSAISSSDESKRDSGLIEGELSMHGSEVLGGDSSANSSPIATVGRTDKGVLVPPTTDQVSALAQLTHLMNEYLSIATQQDTHIEKMHLKMGQGQARDKLQNRRRLGNNLQDIEARRNHLKQSELEQELIRKEEQLKTERDKWEKQCRRHQAAMDKERQEFEDQLSKLKKDEIEVERQQEEVKRAKDECQRQMARLRELQRKAAQDSGMIHSLSYPNSLANKNNNNSNVPSTEDTDYYIDEDREARTRTGSNLSNLVSASLASMPTALSKSHSSLEGDTPTEGISKDPSPSPTYTSSSDYPRTFPGVTKRDQPQSFFPPPQHHHSVQPPVANSAPAANLPIHLQYSASNQLGHAAQIGHNRLPGKLMSSTKSNRSNQMIPPKLTKLASSSSSSQSSQSSQKQTFTDGLKNKLPFSHHKKTPRATNSSSELIEAMTGKNSTGLSMPNNSNLKHSKSEANMDVSNRFRSTSSPAPFNLSPPETALERSNSASSNSSKEGEKEKKKKNKRGSWGSNSDKQNGKKEIYF